jgi:hypothetical protein
MLRACLQWGKIMFPTFFLWNSTDSYDIPTKFLRNSMFQHVLNAFVMSMLFIVTRTLRTCGMWRNICFNQIYLCKACGLVVPLISWHSWCLGHVDEENRDVRLGFSAARMAAWAPVVDRPASGLKLNHGMQVESY